MSIETRTYYISTPNAYCPSGTWAQGPDGINICVSKDAPYTLSTNEINQIVGSIFGGIGLAVIFGVILWIWVRRQSQKVEAEETVENC